MALRLYDVQRDPIANRARRYTVAEEKSGLVLTEKAGNMKLFLNDLDDLHQWDFIQNQKMVKENERLRALLRTIHEQWESWRRRALAAEATLVETAAKATHPMRMLKRARNVKRSVLRRGPFFRA
jgi:hypothetical protein